MFAYRSPNVSLYTNASFSIFNKRVSHFFYDLIMRPDTHTHTHVSHVKDITIYLVHNTSITRSLAWSLQEPVCSSHFIFIALFT